MKNEPVRLTYLAAAIVGALVRLGIPIPAEYRELATTLLVVVLPVIAGEFARRRSWGPETVAKLQAELVAAKAGK